MPGMITPEDSAYAIVRAAAAAMRKRFHFLVPSSVALVSLARYSRHHQRALAEQIVEKFVYKRALPQNRAQDIDFEQACDEVTKLYEPKIYKSIILGAPSGGIAHLSALLHSPFLSTHFLFSFRDQTVADDVKTYFLHGKELATTILRHNRSIEVVNHYDPVHDRWLIRQVNHIRLKATRLPESYKRFILENLADDGTVIFANCAYSWIQYEVGRNHYFQIGGLGGYAPRDFLEGHPSFLAQGFPEKGWKLREYPEVERAESEWGSSLSEEEVASFCSHYGFRFVSLKEKDPFAYSVRALELYEKLLQRINLSKPHVLWIDCFNLLNPAANVATSIPSLWVPFNTKDSFISLQKELEKRKNYDVFYLSLVPSLSPSADVVAIHDWIRYLSKKGVIYLVGMEKQDFPLDFAGPLRYPFQIKHFVRSFYSPLTARATLDDLLASPAAV